MQTFPTPVQERAQRLLATDRITALDSVRMMENELRVHTNPNQLVATHRDAINIEMEVSYKICERLMEHNTSVVYTLSQLKGYSTHPAIVQHLFGRYASLLFTMQETVVVESAAPRPNPQDAEPPGIDAALIKIVRESAAKSVALITMEAQREQLESDFTKEFVAACNQSPTELSLTQLNDSEAWIENKIAWIDKHIEAVRELHVKEVELRKSLDNIAPIRQEELYPYLAHLRGKPVGVTVPNTSAILLANSLSSDDQGNLANAFKALVLADEAERELEIASYLVKRAQSETADLTLQLRTTTVRRGGGGGGVTIGGATSTQSILRNGARRAKQ
jgi:hypothetical protein